jgi:membrane-bound serine protease (ClpP class)
MTETVPALGPSSGAARARNACRRSGIRAESAAAAKSMRRFSISPVFSGLLAALLLSAISSPACAEVLKIVVNDTIHPITDEYIGRALVEAERNKDQALLIEINTPGGLLESTRDIIEKILAAPVPVVIYVTPSGSRAASAGFFILESADVAAMAPGTNTGAAHPVTIGGGKIDDVMKEKLENDSAALMRSVVSKRGRNVEVAESAVRQSKSFTDQEALSQKLIDYVASSEEDLLRQLQGKPVKRFNGQTVTLNLAGEPIRNYDMTLKQRILAYIMNPNVAFILLAIGALALYAEFNHPGAVVPGTVGVVFILLAIFALNLLPVRFAALVLILTSFVLFALEAKFATHGVLTIGGIVTMVLGGLLLVDAPIPEMRVHLLTALAVSIPLGLITAFLMSIALKARRNKVVTGAQGLVGEIGLAQTVLSPQGKVFVHGELWDAVASANVSAGQTVVVRNVDGLQLQVEPVPSVERTPAATMV